ncbi:hypothetical protein GCM10029964_087720 [Kibdelosporangium lantanae]
MTDAPLLLLGAQRSGTTALAFALSRAYAEAGGIFTVNGKLPYLLPRWTTPADLAGRHLRADEILHTIHRKPPAGDGVDKWLDGVDRVLRQAAAAVARGEHTDPADLIAQAYAAWPRWGDKYNEYLLDLPEVLRTVPGARLVLLVRHPLEAAASQLEWSGDRPWRPTTVADACAKWVSWHLPWFEVTADLDPTRYLVIDYRALCAGRATDRLTEFCGLDLAPHLTGMRATRPAEDTTDLPPDVARVWHALCERESTP